MAGLIAMLALALGAVGGLFVQSVPKEAAAKVNDTYIQESTLASQIAQFRTTYQLEDDQAFANYLVDQGLNVSSFRISFINDAALSLLIDKEAQRLNVVPSDDAIQSSIDNMKSSLALSSQEIWQSTLTSFGMTEDSLWQSTKTALEKNALFNAEISYPNATDEQALSYAKANLAGITQKHCYFMLFTGEDATQRAAAVSAQLLEASAEATLTKDYFCKLALENSDDPEVASTLGSFKWSIEASSDDELSQLYDDLQLGGVTLPNSIASLGGEVILFCDEVYSFPSNEAMENLTQTDIPATLFPLVKDKASAALWENACNAYLTALLQDAQITYYPVPKDAVYNVSLLDAKQAG